MLGSGVGGATALRRVGEELARNERPHSTQMYQLQPDNPTVAVKRLYLLGQNDQPTGTFTFGDLLRHELAKAE